jgi:hypothetical protein
MLLRVRISLCWRSRDRVGRPVLLRENLGCEGECAHRAALEILALLPIEIPRVEIPVLQLAVLATG